MTGYKQILISEEVKERLRSQGQTAESYDKVLRRLLGMEPKERKRNPNEKRTGITRSEVQPA